MAKSGLVCFSPDIDRETQARGQVIKTKLAKIENWVGEVLRSAHDKFCSYF
jgi:hypothetical protein